MSEVPEDPTQLLSAFSEALASAIERTAPSVVQVEARHRNSQGTGVVWTEDGLIVTADHVLERGEDVTVCLSDGKRLSATIVGRDTDRDVALLRTPATDLPAIPRGSPPRVGNIVVAVGRGNGRLMATMGLVNAVRSGHRKKAPRLGAVVIQTDAMLYPGFSGGPLLDCRGRMVGLNSARTQSGASMAVALEAVADAAELLVSGGRTTRGYIGIITQVIALPARLRQELELEQSGALLISGVEEESPAELAGLLIGDILLALDSQPVQDAGDLRVVLAPGRVGETLAADVIRGGQLRRLDVTIGERG